MKTSYHVIASAGISLGYQAAMHSWPATLGCFLSGVLIDIDHYVEYCIFQKKFPFRYKDLVDFCNDAKITKQYLIFHAYELMLIFWFLIYYLDLGVIWTGIALGLTTHMILDQWSNPIKPLYYFMVFRIRNNFIKTKMLSERYFQQGATNA